MTENLILKLEEKTMSVLSELETLRNEVKNLRQENTHLKSEKENSTRKIQDLVTLLDATFSADTKKDEPIYLAEASAA